MKKTKMKITNREQLADTLHTLRRVEAAVAVAVAKFHEDVAAMRADLDRDTGDDIIYAKALTKAALAYIADHQKDLLPAGARSAEISGCLVGLRLSPPKVALVNKGDDWALAALRLDRHPLGKLYVRQAEPEVNKEALIEHRSIVSDWLPKLGLDIVQEEKPFIDTQLGAEKPAEA